MEIPDIFIPSKRPWW